MAAAAPGGRGRGVAPVLRGIGRGRGQGRGAGPGAGDLDVEGEPGGAAEEEVWYDEEKDMLEQVQSEKLRAMLGRIPSSVVTELRILSNYMWRCEYTIEDINAEFEKILVARGFDVDPGRERWVRKAAEGLEKYNIKMNFRLWAKKFSDLVQNAMDEKDKIALALTSMDSSAKITASEVEVVDNWPAWVQECAYLFDAGASALDRRAEIFFIRIGDNEKGSDFYVRYLESMKQTEDWATKSQEQKFMTSIRGYRTKNVNGGGIRNTRSRS